MFLTYKYLMQQAFTEVSKKILKLITRNDADYNTDCVC